MPAAAYQLELFRARPSAEPAPRPDRGTVLEKAQEVARSLARQLGAPVQLSVTDNRSTMVSFARRTPGYVVRVHHMFLEADEAVVAAIARYVSVGPGGAGPALDEFIQRHDMHIRTRRVAGDVLKARGRCFDLAVLMEEINRLHFQSGIQARIGWGKKTPRRKRKSIRLGVYDHQAREIRVHPALDRPDVPRFFVEYIVFHEMLHQLFPSTAGDGRRVHHPKAFRDRERAFPGYAVALAWEKTNLAVLLRR